MSGTAVGIVGGGVVGQTLAASLVTCSLSERLIIAARRPATVHGLTADLQDLAHSARSHTRVEAGTVTDIYGCAAAVIALRTGFTNTARRDVRRAGAMSNAPAVATLARQLRGYDGTVLVVTNPVDLMARLFAEVSGCTRVFGIGSNLDSARYRLLLARHAHVPPEAVHGHILGEHGDRAVVCGSTTTIDGRAATVPVRAVVEELQRRPALIRDGIGRTRCGPTGAVLSTLRKALGLIDGTEELSAPYEDVWLGLLLRFTAGQAAAHLPRLIPSERKHLDAAASSLRDAYTHLPPSPERIAP